MDQAASARQTVWGDSENAVRIQIHVAIITYCLIAIIEHDLHLDRLVFEVMRILGSSLLVYDNQREFFEYPREEICDDGQLEFSFNIF